jgi:hypothetical protein
MISLPKPRFGQVKYLFLALLCVVLIVGTSLLRSTGQVQMSGQVSSADAFVDSIGVNVHFTYTDTAYGNYNDIIKPRLQELGIRHIRDGIVRDRPDQYSKFKELEQDGIYTTLIAGIGWAEPNEVVALAKELGTAQEAVESPNEFDVGKQQSEWVPLLLDYIEKVHEAIKADEATANLPFIGPSFIDGGASQAIGDVSQWVDYGNMHPYNYPNRPGDGNIDNELRNRARPSGDKPMIATEAGYHTGGAESDRPVPEATQGKYIPRLLLEYFNRGVVRTFLYEFIDQRRSSSDKEANFGILRQDGSPKPAFTAIRNLITLLNDPGEQFQPKSLDFSLSGNTADIHQTLLQKQNGNFYLILWQEVTSYNPLTKQEIDVPDRQVTLNLNTAIEEAKLYLPLNSSDSIEQHSQPTRLTLAVPDHPLVIELIPSASS